MNSTINIASTAQKLSSKAKRTKGTSKRVVLYVPDTFDPDVHLPEELRHLADYARYLLHRVNVGRVHLRRGNNLIYLKRDYLVKFIPKYRFTAIRDALVDSGVIHVRKFCIKGEMSFGYRLLPPHNQGFFLYQPTIKRLIDKIIRWRKKESDALRHPVHRELRRYVKALTIDEEAALTSVHGTPFQQAAQVAMIRRIKDGDFFTIPDRYGRFHSNLTNLKKALRPFLRYRDSELVNLDIANSQPIVFCLLLVNALSHEGKLDNLIDYSFPQIVNLYAFDIDEAFLSSLNATNYPTCLSSPSCDFSSSSQIDQESGDKKEKEEGEGEALPILRPFDVENNIIMYNDNMLRQSEFSYDNTENCLNIQESSNNNKEKKGEGEVLPILRPVNIEDSNISTDHNELRSANFSYDKSSNWADDVKEFVELCEQGILYDDLMRRLTIPARRRDSFKRLFFSQVFFGKVKTTGRVRELFARDYPTVYKAINDLKRKDHRQLAYLLQAHESKIMIDIICRKNPD